MKTVKQLITPFLFTLLFSLCLGIVSCDDKNTDPIIPEVPEETSVTLDKTTIELIVSEQMLVTPTFSSETVSKKTFVWNTCKPDIIRFEENQNKSVNITALKEGTVELKITSDDASLSASCQITVLPGEVEEPKGTIRLLGIGNSFTDDALQDYLYHLAVAGGKEIVIARLTIGGATLEEHLDYAQKNRKYSYWKKGQNGNVSTQSKTIAEGVMDKPWDFISFQQQSENSYRYETYENTLPALVDYVKLKSPNPKTVYAVLQCWAYANNYPAQWTDFEDYFGRDQLKMHAGLVDATERASALVTPKLMVIPAGTAIQNGRTSILGDTFCRDGYHLNVNIGRFTVACMWYETFFGNVVDNPYKPDNISEYHAQIAKHAARLAVSKPNQVSEMLDFQ